MHFLIVKTSSLGDIVHTFPVVSYLKIKFPDCHIDWIAERSNYELLKSHPDINNVFLIDTKKWDWKELFKIKRRYDAIFDFQGNVKSGLLLFFLEGTKVGFGRKSVPEWPNLFFTNKRFDPPKGLNIREDNLYLVRQFFQDEGSIKNEVNLKITKEEEILLAKLKKGPKVLVCPGSRWKNKELPRDTLQTFLNEPYYVTHGYEMGGTMLPKLSVPLLQNLMNEMELVIAMDSFPLHLAATTKTKTLSFFGPSLGKKYAPPGHTFHQGSCPYNITFEKRCPKLRTCKTGACIININKKS